MMDGSPSSSAILPRMSVCLKGSRKLHSEIDGKHGTPYPRFITQMDNYDGDNTIPGNSRRSVLSKSSVLLTGTSSSILSTPQFDTKKSAEKARTQCEGVRFSETVIIRNHIHVKEITPEEKVAAWFRKPEYHAIFKNNTKIIGAIGKREKEQKRAIAKKRRGDRKKKKKRNSFCEESSVGSSVATFNTDDVQDEEVQLEHILGIHRDDEQGFSVRGLENETTKRRRARDEVYMKAKFVVLSIQEDVDEHMFMMQEEYEDRLTDITTGNKGQKKKSKRRSKVQSTPPEDDDDAEKTREKIDALRKEFSRYASEQYHCMIKKIAEDYGEICKQNAKDALERGLQDERAVKAIDWIETEGLESYTASIQSSGKGMSDASPEEKRRPSNASTAATVESAASLLALKESQVNKFGRMKRAKMFLWKIAS
jgi:hypothetical protein